MKTDIGDAKITHTIFGKARVRVIRQQDRSRRKWLIVALVVVTLVAASWQSWTVLQHMQKEVPPLPLSERVLVSPPAFQPAYPSVPEIPGAMSKKLGMSIQPELNIPVISNQTIKNPAATSKVVPPLPVKPPVQMTEKPITAKPLTANKSQAVKLQATNAKTATHETAINPGKNQAIAKQPSKPLPPKRAEAPVAVNPPVAQPIKTTVATPPAAQSVMPTVVADPAVTQSPASKAADGNPPLNKESPPASAPTITNQSLAPVNTQP
jgi:hypothetical protein